MFPWYVPWYSRGVKELHGKIATREELIRDAKVISKSGYHPGVPLLFGVYSKKVCLTNWLLK